MKVKVVFSGGSSLTGWSVRGRGRIGNAPVLEIAWDVSRLFVLVHAVNLEKESCSGYHLPRRPLRPIRVASMVRRGKGC